MKKFAAIILSLMLIFGSFQFSYALTPEPQIVADTGVLIDGATGQVLFNKQMDKQKYPASTTKVMTALLTVENLDLNQKVIIDAEVPFTDGTRIYLTEGEEVTVEQLLNSMLIESANDSAKALAKTISGSVPEFANLMNQRAKELGAKNTNFHNPNGLTDDLHVTTAYDLAMIAREGLKHPEIRKVITTYRYVFPATNKQPERYLYNRNKLIFDTDTKVNYNGVMIPLKYDGITGFKTGFTPAAGYCLVASAKRNGMELISVVFQSDSTNVFLDSIKLLDYGFANYKSVLVTEKGKDVGAITVKGGESASAKAFIGEDVYATLPIEASPDIVRTEINLDKFLKAPIEEGQKIGAINVFEGNNQIGEFPIVAKSAVPESAWLSILNIFEYIKYLLITMILLCIGFLITWIVIKRRKIKRKRLERHRMFHKSSKEIL